MVPAPAALLALLTLKLLDKERRSHINDFDFDEAAGLSAIGSSPSPTPDPGQRYDCEYFSVLRKSALNGGRKSIHGQRISPRVSVPNGERPTGAPGLAPGAVPHLSLGKPPVRAREQHEEGRDDPPRAAHHFIGERHDRARAVENAPLLTDPISVARGPGRVSREERGGCVRPPNRGSNRWLTFLPPSRGMGRSWTEYPVTGRFQAAARRRRSMPRITRGKGMPVNIITRLAGSGIAKKVTLLDH